MSKEQSESESVNVNRARCDSLNIYDVTEGELEIIKRGSSNSIFLNISLTLLSVGVSFLITLLTVDINSRVKFDVFVVLCIFGFGVGFVLLILWWKSSDDFKDTIKSVEERLKIDSGELEDVSDDEESILLDFFEKTVKK